MNRRSFFTYVFGGLLGVKLIQKDKSKPVKYKNVYSSVSGVLSKYHDKGWVFPNGHSGTGVHIEYADGYYIKRYPLLKEPTPNPK